jgi:WXG100 family type VII secretion target
MAEFKVTPEMLKSTSSSLKNINSRFRSVMEGIETDMRAMKQKWDSEAADTFLAKFEKFKSNLEGYYQVVESYSKFLEETAQAYSESDKSINNLTANLFV